jgi:hypothetical protein
MPAAGQIIRAADFPTAVSATQATDETAFASTTFAPGAAPCGVTFVAPTSGQVLVEWSARFESNSTNHTLISVVVRAGGVIGSGSEASAAADGSSIEFAAGADVNVQDGTHRFVSGLTAGSTYNAQVEMRVTASTADIFDRRVTVIPLS